MRRNPHRRLDGLIHAKKFRTMSKALGRNAPDFIDRATSIEPYLTTSKKRLIADHLSISAKLERMIFGLCVSNGGRFLRCVVFSDTMTMKSETYLVGWADYVSY